MASNYYLGVDGNWTNTANWSTGSVPVSTDDVFLANSATDITSNLNQSAVALASLTIDATYTGKIGAASSYLQIDATTLNIGRQPGDSTASGSNRLHLKGTYSTVNVIDTATTSADVGFPPVCLAGSITQLNVRSGKVGVAVLTPIETATATTVNVTKSDSASNDPVVILGNVTSTTIHVEAGKLVNKSNVSITTVNVVGGEYRQEGNSAITTALIEGGKFVQNGTGTISALNVYNAVADFSNDPRAKTVTALTLGKGGSLNINTGVKGSVTLTGGIYLVACDIDDVTLRLGPDHTVLVP